jgi:N-acetylmuramoyl-L-alanine amidase
MSGAKLNKKHERNMSSTVKNGKLRTNNITVLNLILLGFLASVLDCFPQNQVPQKTWTVVIDAGHGGKDPGALGSMSREKNINLAIALKAGEYIKQNVKNVKVLYTRSSDVFVEVKERAEFANRNKADLFISIHANWASSKSVKGAETYVMGVAKDQENLEVAMKENEVILLEDDYSTKYEGFDPKSPESYIMFALMQNIFHEQSTGLASNIQDQFRDRAGRVDRGVRQAGFWVLYMTTMPSVLIETGYMTNSEEEKYLVSKEGQEYLASAIYRACRDYINQADRKNGISTAVAEEPTVKEKIPLQSGREDKQESNVTFMVQIAASTTRKDLKPENFKGLKNISELASDGIYKYAIGNFQDYPSAVDHRKKLVHKYPDSFVIAVKDNKILPLQDAMILKNQK